MPTDRPTAGQRPAHTRSAVTNGRALFVDGDGRSPWARRWRDLCHQHAADLGGEDRLSEAQRSLIRRAATLAMLCEAREGDLSRGQEVDLAEYQSAANALRRILATLGLERRAGNVTPDLRDYLSGRASNAG